MRTLCALLLAMSCLACAPLATGNAYYGFTLGVTSVPPPRVVIVDSPALHRVPGTSVYVVENSGYDVFRYSSFWYVCAGDSWYRSRSSSGPFVAVDVRSVPSQVLTVPAKHWKRHPHGGPPGRMRS